MGEEVSRERYEEIVRGFARGSVLVVGDLMMDEYLRGAVRRISPESPVMIVEVEGEEFKPGGAANVASNLLDLGARVMVAGVVGEDEIGRLLKAELEQRGMGTGGILADPSRPTTRKTRVVAQSQQVLRVDREQTHPIAPQVACRLLEVTAAHLNDIDAVLLSDYRKGVLTPETVEGLCEQARAAGKPLLANAKPASAKWLRGARVVSFNSAEAEELARARVPDDLIELQAYGVRLLNELDVEMLVITRGAKGLAYWRNDGEFRHIPAHVVEVFDVAGAGDTTISAMTLALISGASAHEAAFIANHAGACVVRKSGVATVHPDELIEDWNH